MVGLEEEHEPLLDVVSQMAAFIIALHSVFLRGWDRIWQHWPVNVFTEKGTICRWVCTSLTVGSSFSCLCV